MGFASYLEDIIENLDTGSRNSSNRKYYETKTIPKEINNYETKAVKELRILLRVAKQRLEEAVKLADIATDPAIDQAQLIIKLKSENKKLRNSSFLTKEVVRLKDENKRLRKMSQIDEIGQFLALEDECEKLSLNLENTKKELNKIQNDNQNLTKKNKTIENKNEIFNLEIDKLKNKIKHLEKEKQDLESTITDLRSSIKNLEISVKDLKEEIEIIQNPENLYDKYI